MLTFLCHWVVVEAAGARGARGLEEPALTLRVEVDDFGETSSLNLRCVAHRQLIAQFLSLFDGKDVQIRVEGRVLGAQGRRRRL